MPELGNWLAICSDQGSLKNLTMQGYRPWVE